MQWGSRPFIFGTLMKKHENTIKAEELIGKEESCVTMCCDISKMRKMRYYEELDDRWRSYHVSPSVNRRSEYVDIKEYVAHGLEWYINKDGE